MLAFFKKFFSRNSPTQSFNREEEEDMALQEAVKSPKQSEGPRNFANQESIDYLLANFRYEPIPALSKRPILLNSLFTINEDIQAALLQDYPYLENMITSGFSDESWYGSQVHPKYIHLGQQLMEVDFKTTLTTCKAVTLEDLESLAFIDGKSDEWLHNQDYTLEVFTLADICKQVDVDSGQIHLHLIIDNGNAFSSEENQTADQLKVEIGNRLKSFTENDYANGIGPLWQAIVEVYNSKFFPAELIIREACLTNLVQDGSSSVYGHKYFYF